MKAPRLRIKFTPLLLNFHKDNSDPQLEIVPEITCIENLDKIEWKNKENTIEYTIPMTYKIILKNKNVINDGTTDKVYHSCIDLLIQSSDTKLMALESGDVNKIFSDTIVLSKDNTDVEKWSILKELNEYNIHKDEGVQNIIETKNNQCHCTQYQLHGSHSLERFIKTWRIRLPAAPQVLLSEPHSDKMDIRLAEITNNNIDNIITTKANHKNKIDLLLLNNPRAPSVSSKIDIRHRLSLTPIYSIDTSDSNIETMNVIPRNSFISHVNDINKDSSTLEETDERMKALNSYYNVFNKVRNNYIAPDKQFEERVEFEKYLRILPEERVEKIVKLMEKELKPIQIMLNQILNKCFTLGLIKKKYKNYKPYKNEMKAGKDITKSHKRNFRTESNQVVYSIVFED